MQRGCVSDGLGCGHGGWQSRRDLCGVGDEPLRPPRGGHLPFQGRLCVEVRPQKAPSAEGAKGFSVCGRGISPLRRRPKGFAIALWKPSPPAGAIAVRSRRLCQPP